VNPAPRIAVTRDEDAAGPLSRALLERGLMPVSCPVVRGAEPEDLGPFERAALALDEFDWLVVASRRAVAALVAVRRSMPWPAGLRTAGVGSVTAEALRAAGAAAPLTAPAAGAAALAAALREADDWRGRRVLLPRAAEGGRELADSLRAAGAEVTEVIAYRTLPRPAQEIARDWSAARPDAVVLASPSAVRALVAGVGAAALRALRAVIAIGPTTSAALAALEVPSHVPAQATFESAADLARGLLTPNRWSASIPAASAAVKEPKS
jgi:uroporphyrinogen-III synthase/uroporphyrinogen III methyltransferase/synthase